MSRSKFRCPLPHAQIHLPPLCPHEALLLQNLLDKTIVALWRAHGDAMNSLLCSFEKDPDLPCQLAVPDSHITSRTKDPEDDIF